MPIYEYSCQKCRTRVEVMQKITDAPLQRCQKCKGKLEKEWSTTSFQLKGSGWYVTDYAAKKTDAKEGDTKEPDTAKSTGDAAKNTDAAAAKTESATESKSESSTDSARAEDKKKKKTSQPAATSKPSKSD